MLRLTRGYDMKIKYLQAWIRELPELALPVQRLTLWQDQILFNFKDTRTSLQINLSSLDCFCLFTDKPVHEFREAGSLGQFRKYLQHLLLTKVTMLNLDRILALTFSSPAGKELYMLVVELIPADPALILLSVPADGGSKIMAVWRRKTSQLSGNRLIIGNSYQPPAKTFTADDREIVYPVSFDEQGKIREGSRPDSGFRAINPFLEAYYRQYIDVQRRETARRQKLRELDKELQKSRHKLALLKEELSSTGLVEHWQQLAELLKSNLSQIRTGSKSFTTVNYFHPDLPRLEIPLEPDKTARENLDIYLKKYRKARDGRLKIAEQVELTSAGIERLEEEYRQVTALEEFQPATVSRPGTTRSPEKVFSTIRLDDWEILIGRNQEENDYLTTRVARPWDWWFHTRIFRGSHLILRNLKKQEPPVPLIEICCRLAAYFSKARNSSQIPVDYTQKRYLRKPRHSAPGQVVYSQHKTIFADPLAWRAAREQLKKEGFTIHE